METLSTFVISQHECGGVVHLAVRPHANCQALSCVFYEDEPSWRSVAKLLTKDEARRIEKITYSTDFTDRHNGCS
jgi:hypothetical protein